MKLGIINHVLYLPDCEKLIDIVLRHFLNSTESKIHKITNQASVLSSWVVHYLQLLMKINWSETPYNLMFPMRK